MAETKKYASLESLQTFKTNADNLYATKVALDGKANSVHTHEISDVTNLQSTLDGKVPTSRTVNGKALSSNITISASDLSVYTKAEIDAMSLITTDDIDTICNASIVAATEVTY